MAYQWRRNGEINGVMAYRKWRRRNGGLWRNKLKWRKLQLSASAQRRRHVEENMA